METSSADGAIELLSIGSLVGGLWSRVTGGLQMERRLGNESRGGWGHPQIHVYIVAHGLRPFFPD